MTWKQARRHVLQKWWITILVAVAALGFFFAIRPRPRFGEEQFARLHEGLTEAEVIEILGCPPGDFRPDIWKNPDWYVSTSDPIGSLRSERGRSLQELDELERQDTEEWVLAGQPIPPAPARVQWKRWWDRYSGIDVAIDSNQCVIHWSLHDVSPPRPPRDPLRRIRWQLGW